MSSGVIGDLNLVAFGMRESIGLSQGMPTGNGSKMVTFPGHPRAPSGHGTKLKGV